MLRWLRNQLLELLHMVMEVDVVAMVEVAGITSEMEEAMGLTGIKVVVRVQGHTESN